MAKTVDTPMVLQERGLKVDKNLSFTKDEYLSIIRSVTPEIMKTRKMAAKGDKAAVSELRSLYGIYYTSFAGMIRSGMLCRRITDYDGFPKITIMIGDSEKYDISESSLIGIFGKESEYLIHPYSDDSDSYIKDPFAELTDINVTLNTSEGTSSKAEIRKLENEHKKEIAKLKSDYEREIRTLKQGDAAVSSQTPAVDADIMDAVNKARQEDMYTLEEERKQFDFEKKRLQNVIASQKKDFDKFKAEKEKEDAERKKYVYDPNYDHYYNDVLPKLLDSLEFSHTDTLLRGLSIAVSLAAVAASLFVFV